MDELLTRSNCTQQSTMSIRKQLLVTAKPITRLESSNKTNAPKDTPERNSSIHPILSLLDQENPNHPIHLKTPCEDLPIGDEFAFVRGNVSIDAKIITVVVVSFPKCPLPGIHKDVVINYTIPLFPPKQTSITRTCDVENGRQIPTSKYRTVLYDKKTDQPRRVSWICRCRFGGANGHTFTKRNLRDIRRRVCIMKLRLRFDKHDRFGKLVRDFEKKREQ